MWMYCAVTVGGTSSWRNAIACTNAFGPAALTCLTYDATSMPTSWARRRADSGAWAARDLEPVDPEPHDRPVGHQPDAVRARGCRARLAAERSWPPACSPASATARPRRPPTRPATSSRTQCSGAVARVAPAGAQRPAPVQGRGRDSVAALRHRSDGHLRLHVAEAGDRGRRTRAARAPTDASTKVTCERSPEARPGGQRVGRRVGRRTVAPATTTRSSRPAPGQVVRRAASRRVPMPAILSGEGPVSLLGAPTPPRGRSSGRRPGSSRADVWSQPSPSSTPPT